MSSPLDLLRPQALLGALSPQDFMRKHWQRKPLVVRQALPGITPPVSRSQLFDLAGRDEVESRLVQQQAGQWRLRQGPFSRRTLPAAKQPHWTLLLQGLDLHNLAAKQLLRRFRFVPEARLDDLMISWASDGGGVGPHLDSYDVFLIQVQGQRRWRIGRAQDTSFIEGLPLKILRNFAPTDEYLLTPGDMLYLPPRWAHEGVAVGECMTCSVGFRSPTQQALAADLAGRLADENDAAEQRRYKDPSEAATASPGAIPEALQRFARDGLEALLRQPGAVERALGEALTEPKAQVWFEGTGASEIGGGLTLALGTRMMYDDKHIFINGESFRASGRDARLLKVLADSHELPAPHCRQLSADAQALVAQWVEQGWLLPIDGSSLEA